MPKPRYPHWGEELAKAEAGQLDVEGWDMLIARSRNTAKNRLIATEGQVKAIADECHRRFMWGKTRLLSEVIDMPIKPDPED